MSIRIRAPKDFWAGLLYGGLGVTAVVIAREYGMGSSSRMGPGYFPTILGSLLTLIGIASIVRSLASDGEPIGAIAWKPIALVTLATVLFGALLRPAGLVVALLALVVTSAAASVRFRLEARSIALMVALIAFCGLVFVKGLGMPVSLVGTWFGA